MGAVFAMALIAIGLVLWGAVTSRRSSLIGVVALGVASYALLAAWHGWAEMRALGWVLGYLSGAAVAVFTAYRHLGGRRGKGPPPPSLDCS